MNTTVDLDVQRLSDWIGDRLPGHGEPLSAERIGQDVGIANALFAVHRGEHVFVLRRPPLVINAPGASDMAREWRVLKALEGSDVPHPQPLLFCEDADAIGAPFLIMSLVDGFTPVRDLPAPYDNPKARHDLGLAMVDAIASLGQVDWRAAGLEGFGRPEGFLERQVPRWLKQLRSYSTREIPELDTVATWLENHIPTVAQEPGLLHGDYSAFNVMASWHTTGRLAAVVDWDSATVGDPLLDLGHLLARWTEPGEESSLTSLDIDTREGLPTRAEMAERYAQRTGRDLEALAYYEVLALFRLAIILEGGVRRAVAEGDSEKAVSVAGTVDRLIRYAAIFARGERV